MSFQYPEQYRIRKGEFASEPGGWGMFLVPTGLRRPYPLRVVATDEHGWQHVSVALPLAMKRCPSWEEMCFAKRLFWEPEDCVVQFHPPESEYVNNHPHCLHLWRPIALELPRPPAILVGIPRACRLQEAQVA